MGVKEPEKPSGPIPYFSTTKRDGLEVPFFQTLIDGGLPAAAAVVGTLLTAWGVNIFKPWGYQPGADLVAFVAALSGSIAFFRFAIPAWPKNRDHWEYIVEVGMGADLNQDGVIGDPGKSAKLNVTVNNGRERPPERSEIEYDELPFADRLPKMARMVNSGIRFTFANFGAPGQMFTQPEWTTLTDDMRELGYIRYKSDKTPNLGYDFTPKGKALLQNLVGEGHRIERETWNKEPPHLAEFAVDTAPLPQLRRGR